MRRKATKNTRAANAEEKRFMLWVKEQPCCECGNSPVIVDHMYSSTFRHNKVLIGHWALLPLCESCDSVKTLGSHNAYTDKFGHTQAQAWEAMMQESVELTQLVPIEVYNSIMDWGR